MKRFEEGKTYKMSSGEKLTVVKRTPCYATFAGAFNCRVKVHAFPAFECALVGKFLIPVYACNNTDR